MPARATRQSRAASGLLQRSAQAAPAVIAARMLALSHPANAGSAWSRAETRRMASEKFQAAGAGLAGAWFELALMPGRAIGIASDPRAWTLPGCLTAWMSLAALWTGVGNAALRPAARTVARNRTRLARRTRF